jgi:uncharacterized delta-60 repeat protein
MKKLLILSTLFIVSTVNALVINNQTAVSQPAAIYKAGELDRSFGIGGKAITSISSGQDYIAGIKLQSDGKIVAAGYSDNGTDNDFAVVRYNSDGSLDSSFGTGGKVTTAVGSGLDEANGVVLQSDGKIVVVGYSYNGTDNDFAVVRYNSDGSLDSSFGTGGKVTTAVGSGSDQIYGVALQSDGKIVVVGYSNDGTDKFATVRYNTNGLLDSSFGIGGKVITDIGSLIDRIYAVTIQLDGKIVVAGITHNGTNYDIAIARYDSDGSLDSTFGGNNGDDDGTVTTAIGSGNDFTQGIVIQPNGKIVAVGFSYNGSNNDFAIVRYDSNGLLDISFNSDGKATVAIGSGIDRAHGVVIQSDGKIVAAGVGDNGSSNDFAIARYNSDGSLDTSFGDSGTKLIDIDGSSSDWGSSLLIQSDGKIVMGGAMGVSAGLIRFVNDIDPLTQAALLATNGLGLLG